MISWLLLCTLVSTQDLPDLTGREVDGAVTVEFEITPADPELEDRGPSRTFAYTPDFSGSLHAWLEGPDPYLRVSGPEGVILARQVSPDVCPVPYLQVAVRPGESLRIQAACSLPDDSTTLTLHLASAVESEQTRQAVDAARMEVSRMRASIAAADYVAARERLRAAAAVLLDVEGAESSTDVAHVAAAVVGAMAFELVDVETTRSCNELALRHYQSRLPGEHRFLLGLHINLAWAYKERGELQRALALEENVVATLQEHAPEDDFQLLGALENLGVTRSMLGEFASAAELFYPVFETRSRILPVWHENLSRTRVNLAESLRLSGRLFEAKELLDANLALLDAHEGRQPHLPEMRNRAFSHFNLAVVLMDLGDIARGRQHARTSYEIAHDNFADYPTLLASTEGLLGVLLDPAEESDEALRLIGSFVEGTAHLNAEHPQFRAARTAMGFALYLAKRHEQARAFQEETLTLLEQVLPTDHPNLIPGAGESRPDAEGARRPRGRPRPGGEGPRRSKSCVSRGPSPAAGESHQPDGDPRRSR